MAAHRVTSEDLVRNTQRTQILTRRNCRPWPSQYLWTTPDRIPGVQGRVSVSIRTQWLPPQAGRDPDLVRVASRRSAVGAALGSRNLKGGGGWQCAVPGAPAAANGNPPPRSAPCGSPPVYAAGSCARPGPTPPCASQRSAPQDLAVARRGQGTPVPSLLVRSSESNRVNALIGKARQPWGNPGSEFTLAKWALPSQPGIPSRNSWTGRGREEKRWNRRGKHRCRCSLFSSHCPSVGSRGPEHFRVHTRFSLCFPFASISRFPLPLSLFCPP
jgi:hypothetical protein